MQIIDFLRKSVFIDEGQKIPNQGRAVKLQIDSRPKTTMRSWGNESTIYTSCFNADTTSE